MPYTRRASSYNGDLIVGVQKVYVLQEGDFSQEYNTRGELEKVSQKAFSESMSASYHNQLDLTYINEHNLQENTKPTHIEDGSSGGQEPEVENENIESSSTKSNIKANAEKGALWEQKVELLKSATQDNLVKQITIKTKSGIKTKIDLVGTDKVTGVIKLTEAKASATAPFTFNQLLGFPEILNYGGTVVGKGKPPFVGGTVIPPTKVDVVRPKE